MGRRKLRQFWWVFPIGRRKCLGRWKLVSRLLPRRPTHTHSSPLSCHAPTEISLDAALARRHRHMPSPRATAKRCYLLTPAREDASRPPRIATRARPALTPPVATILDARPAPDIDFFCHAPSTAPAGLDVGMRHKPTPGPAQPPMPGRLQQPTGAPVAAHHLPNDTGLGCPPRCNCPDAAAPVALHDAAALAALLDATALTSLSQLPSSYNIPTTLL
jgi:hypothetical protein